MAELTTNPMTKIIGKPGKGDISILVVELTDWAAKMKTAEDIIKKEEYMDS